MVKAKRQTKPESCARVSRSSEDLPPCRVCRDKATGYHYGANTCEACKVW